jgi:hypothetical protein
MDIPVYEGKLDAKELLDWIRALDTYFDYEDFEEDKKVKHVVTRLKGHATLWWDELQADRCCNTLFPPACKYNWTGQELWRTHKCEYVM